ncbi:hypothetical protein M422DRAFT_244775 [Sphaerobolus stellatus SS14]|nr:hypothetical protein M422DRAFT_244775 [Sphaerobolus stellatus SS14]
MSTIDSQPQAVPLPSRTSFKDKVISAKQKVTTADGWLGSYDYAWLCIPTLPFTKSYHKRAPPFYGLNENLPILLAVVTGLQHALAMLAGLITPPIIFASSLNLDAPTSAYLISASLIGCGILSLLQMSRIKLFGGYYIGTGLISVVGTSFSTLSTATSIFNALYKNGTCPSTTMADGTVVRGSCPEAYGMLLGTIHNVMVNLPLLIAFLLRQEHP